MEHGEDVPVSKLEKTTVKMGHTKNVCFKNTYLLEITNWSQNTVLEAGLSECLYYRLDVWYSIRMLACNDIIQFHSRERNLITEIGKVVRTLPEWK